MIRGIALMRRIELEWTVNAVGAFRLHFGHLKASTLFDKLEHRKERFPMRGQLEILGELVKRGLAGISAGDLWRLREFFNCFTEGLAECGNLAR
jgi:hypothetical protein